MAATDALLGFWEKRYFEASCAGKDRYPSRAAAEAVMILYKSRRIKHAPNRAHTDFWAELEVYRCEFCMHYHAGHA
jgi:hypothetical protein